MDVRAASDWRRRDPASVMETIAAAGIVAVLRASDAGRFERVAEVLVEAGVTCVEFTLTSPGAVEALRRFAARMPAGVTLSAGTVLEPGTADAAIDAGASYLVSPTVGLDVIERARRRGVAALPGAFTPTEILWAWRAGADAVKLFRPRSAGRRTCERSGRRCPRCRWSRPAGSGWRRSGATSTPARLPSGSAARWWATPGRAGTWGRCGDAPRRPSPRSARPARHDRWRPARGTVIR
jgi:2-dehydro-3-deoxyphosphogluconate aldolase/(4S)-4-hydroxy-2-oxoglutarate aldolase